MNLSTTDCNPPRLVLRPGPADGARSGGLRSKSRTRRLLSGRTCPLMCPR